MRVIPTPLLPRPIDVGVSACSQLQRGHRPIQTQSGNLILPTVPQTVSSHSLRYYAQTKTPIIWNGQLQALLQTINRVMCFISLFGTNRDARVVVTLTSNGTLVGTGNAAYIWATATWDEVNDIPDVTEVGNYFLISLEEPSDLDVRLPASDILNPPWYDPTGNTKTDADLTGDTKLLISDGDDVTLNEIYEHHDQNHTGLTSLSGYEFKTGSATPDAGDVALPTPSRSNRRNLLHKTENRCR